MAIVVCGGSAFFNDDRAIDRGGLDHDGTGRAVRVGGCLARSRLPLPWVLTLVEVSRLFNDVIGLIGNLKMGSPTSRTLRLPPQICGCSGRFGGEGSSGEGMMIPAQQR